jgi:hypothetical protein
MTPSEGKGGNVLNEKVFVKMSELSNQLIAGHAVEMQKAFQKSDDGRLTVAISYVVEPSKVAKGAIDVDATISFTMEKIKEKVTSRIMEKQEELPLGGK